LLTNWKPGGAAAAAEAAREVPVPAHVPPVPGLAQVPAQALAHPVHGLAQVAAAAVAEAALWVRESRMFSGEARQARQVDHLPALGRDRHLRHPQATHDRAGPQVEVPVQGPRVLGRVPARTARVLEVRRHRGQPRPILGAATPHRPTGAPPSGQPWEDQGRPTLEAADPPWEEVVSFSLGRLEGVLLQSVEEASSNPDQATVVQAWWVPGWQVLGLEVLQEQELEALPAPLAQGALVVLAVPVPVPDLEVQVLDLAPAPVLAQTRVLAPPALSETGDQPLDLPPPPLLVAGAFLEPVWQEGSWEGLQVAQEGA